MIQSGCQLSTGGADEDSRVPSVHFPDDPSPSGRKQKRKKKERRRLHKRELITIALCTAFVLYCIVTTAVSYFWPGSDHNRINSIEEREKLREKEIKDLQDGLKKAREIRNSTIEEIAQLSRQVDSNKRASIYLANLIPIGNDLSYHLNNKLDRSIFAMKSAISSCQRHQIPPTEMSEILNLPMIAEMTTRAEDT